MSHPTDEGQPQGGPPRFPDSTIVLIVEDETLIAWDLDLLLRNNGAADVVLASSLAQARRVLDTPVAFTVALLDLRLGDESGADLIEELQRRNIAIVLTTGYSEPAQSAFPVVSKPYSYPLLLRTIMEAATAGRRHLDGPA